jgi:SAM-dependent methyltransferase
MTEETDISDARTYFTRAAHSFDTLYDNQRSAFMRAVDRRFRSDMYVRFALTFELLSPMEHCTVLDVGCGSGPYLAEALKRGAEYVVGIDMAPTMLELASKRLSQFAPDTYSLKLGVFPDDRPPSAFDYAIVVGVMDYVSDPAVFLSALTGYVTKSAVLSFPSRHWFRTPVRKIRYRIKRCPVYFYDEMSIRDLLQRSGFRAVRVIKIAGAGMDYVVVAEPPLAES